MHMFCLKGISNGSSDFVIANGCVKQHSVISPCTNPTYEELASRKIAKTRPLPSSYILHLLVYSSIMNACHRVISAARGGFKTLKIH